jgi:hypothetical protein
MTEKKDIESIGGDTINAIQMQDVYLGNNNQSIEFEWKIDPVNFMKFGTRTLVANDHGKDVYMEAGTILVQPKIVATMKP